MLRKARRELDRIEREFSVDHVFNFFVTAFHVTDYLKMSGEVSPEKVKDLRNDERIRKCADVCNKAKHFKLERSRPDISSRQYSGAIGGAPIGMLPINSSGARFIVWEDGSQLEIVSFARATIATLEEFFATNTIDL
jgi:hypothetical protein